MGKNTFPSVARQIGKHAETLALHACDESLADEIKVALVVEVTPEMVGLRVLGLMRRRALSSYVLRRSTNNSRTMTQSPYHR